MVGGDFCFCGKGRNGSGLGVLVEDNGTIEHRKIIFHFENVKRKYFSKLPLKGTKSRSFLERKMGKAIEKRR